MRSAHLVGASETTAIAININPAMPTILWRDFMVSTKRVPTKPSKPPREYESTTEMTPNRKSNQKNKRTRRDSRRPKYANMGKHILMARAKSLLSSIIELGGP